MKTLELTAISPLDGRYHQQTRELSNYFSEYALIKYRVQVESNYLKALLSLNSTELTEQEIQSLQTLMDEIIVEFNLEEAQTVKKIESETNHDVKAVEYYLLNKLEKAGHSSQVCNLVHFGLTSEDVNNLAYALMLKEAITKILLPALKNILKSLQTFISSYHNCSMLSRTHGQSASPTTLGKEFANFYTRLDRALEHLTQQEYLGKLNGAVGNFNAHAIAMPDVNWPEFSKKFIDSLGLKNNLYTNQIEPHDFIAELCHNFIRINTILLDLSRDVWHYISLDYFSLKRLKNEVGSSTMPHKVNPIDFENAEGNLGVSSALLSHLAIKLPVSRLQRDLSDSTTLRNIGVGFAHSLLALKSLQKGLNKLQVNSETLENDLNNHFEVIAEAIQSVMRTTSIDSPYEQLKHLTRGEKITQANLSEFIKNIEINDELKKRLISLTPLTYTGCASELCKKLLDRVNNEKAKSK